MYDLDQLYRAIRYPEIAIAEINRLGNKFIRGHQSFHGGVDIFEFDWDNLIILDACRFDTFRARSPFPGNTKMKLSQGTNTAQFIRANFKGRELHDVVYISANPWFLRLHEEIRASVHRYVNLHTGDLRDAAGGLTTHPKTVTEYARATNQEHQDKRLIVHYLQPHQPYLGDFGRERFGHEKDLIVTVKRSGVSRADVIRAYEENFDLVAESVSSLISELEGLTVITSDHGELLGERQRPIPARYYGHPRGIYVPELLRVPWHIIEDHSRKKVKREQPRPLDAEQEAVKEHLSALGYRV